MDNDYRNRLGQIYISNYDTYHRLAAKLLRHYINDTDHAQDIVQDAFVLAAEKDKQSSVYPEAWVAKTIKYLCLNYAKTYYSRSEKLPMVAEETRAKESSSFETETDFWASIEQQLPPKKSMKCCLIIIEGG